MISKTVTMVAAAVASLVSSAGAQDLFLARLNQTQGKLAVDSVVRLTKRPGYDSQPSFMGGAQAVLYTVMDGDGLTDIWRYDLERRTSVPLLTTRPEGEYSAATMPGSDRISVVRVERDSTQRLWSFAPDGSDARVVLEHVKGIGYYTWLNAARVVVYVIGNTSMLEVVDTRTGARRAIAQDVGRTIQKVPGRNAISFVQNAGGEQWICMYDIDTEAMTILVKTPQQNEFYTWTPGGTLLAAEGSVLYAWDGTARGKWNEIANLAGAGVDGISRMIASADGKSLIIVAAD